MDGIGSEQVIDVDRKTGNVIRITDQATINKENAAADITAERSTQPDLWSIWQSQQPRYEAQWQDIQNRMAGPVFSPESPPSAIVDPEVGFMGPQERQTLREKTLGSFMKMGVDVASLLHTPNGKKKVESIKRLVTAIVKENRGSKQKLPFNSTPAVSVGVAEDEVYARLKEHLVNEQAREMQERIDRILFGGDGMTKAEEAIFKQHLPKEEGIDPAVTAKNRWAEFNDTRKNIVAAYDAEEQLKLNREPLRIPFILAPGEVKLKVTSVSREAADQSFRKGYEIMLAREAANQAVKKTK